MNPPTCDVFKLLLFTALLPIIAGCAISASPGRPMAYVTIPLGQPGVQDRRGDFQLEFCKLLAEDKGSPACGDYLNDVIPEFPVAGIKMENYDASKFVLLWLPGIFSECVAGLGKPFDDVIGGVSDRLRYPSYYVPLPGRASSRYNAEIIAKAIDAHVPADKRAILIGYSKGGVDALEMLGADFTANSKVAALITVASPLHGTPLADELGAFYENTFGKIDTDVCPRHDGGEMRSLTVAERRAWWLSHHVPSNIPVYSIAAVPHAGEVSPMLQVLWRKLSLIDPNNDGQVAATDAFAPHGYVLGYVRADHWAVAINFSKSTPIGGALLFKDNFPRLTLYLAALNVVLRDLEKR
ncbi:MAG: hypothetical protein EPN14_10400 [Gallionella sp.]|nr:MAG: hypothetical protein EPN14_10400 [Gallionella sp.]